jgi:hypothetical protein
MISFSKLVIVLSFPLMFPLMIGEESDIDKLGREGEEWTEGELE